MTGAATEPVARSFTRHAYSPASEFWKSWIVKPLSVSNNLGEIISRGWLSFVHKYVCSMSVIVDIEHFRDTLWPSITIVSLDWLRSCGWSNDM